MATYAIIPTGMTAAELDVMFAANEAKAEDYKQKMMANSVPVYLQSQWQEYYDQTHGPPPATQAVVNNGDQIRMYDSAGAELPGSPGSAAVSNSTLNGVQLQSAPTAAIVRNGDSIQVMDASVNPVPGSPGAATVSASRVQFVRLSV